jgi:alpha-glucosidase
VPLPWSGDAPPFGFSPSSARVEPWLPQPTYWARLTVEAQQAEADSMLNLYREALRIRRSEPGLGDGPMTWLSSGDKVLSFRRSDRFQNVTNLSATAVALPPHLELLLASADVVDGLLPPDATAWLRVPAAPGQERLPASSTARGGG